jgi:hypothetical protein
MQRFHAVTASVFGLLLAGAAVMAGGGIWSQEASTVQAAPGIYADMLPGLRTGAVSPAQRRLNTQILNRHLAQGGTLRLRAGSRVEIGGSIRIGSGGAIIGDTNGARPTIYMAAEAFNNRVDVAGAGRYAPNAVGINFSGELSGSFRPTQNVRIEHVALISEQRPGRRLRGIVGQNVSNCTIKDVEIANFPTAVGIALASARGCRLTKVSVHDFSDNTAWDLLAQSTGIEIDNDIVNGRPTSDTLVEGFRIARLRMSGPLLKKWGYQTDGINILGMNSKVDIRDGQISDVGEGIDTFGSGGTIVDVAIANADLFGLKFVHGASRNRAQDIRITNAGLAAVTFSGSDIAAHDTVGNVVSGLTVQGVDPTGKWKDNSTAAILVTGVRSRRVPIGNQVVGADIDLGPNGQYAWVDKSTGSRNRGSGLKLKAGRSTVAPTLIESGATDGVSLVPTP